jgi:REP element-mobilizing transposase RayT
MHFEPNQLYHIYNQGNNRQTIFFSAENYRYFLKWYNKMVSPFADTIAYCLMPNHFHFLICTNDRSAETIRMGSLILTQLSNAIRQLISSYASAINNQEHRSGSLFRQKTKAKLLENSSDNYPVIAFHYIHQNPLQAGLVRNLSDWEFSSYRDYAGLREDGLCNMNLAKKLIDVNWGNLERESLQLYENKKTLIGIF